MGLPGTWGRTAYVGLVLIVAMCTMRLDCEPSGPYSLRISHGTGFDDPFKIFYSTTWLNIHEAHLCDDQGYCKDPAPVCSSNWDDRYQVNVHPGWEIQGREWRRDRVAFFTGHTSVLANPYFAPENPPFISDGYVRYWEGEGESSRIDPVPGPVGLARRYQRGRCSAMIMGASEILRTRLEKGIQSILECARNPLYGCERALRSATPQASDAWQYLGMEDCNRYTSANRDFYHLGYTFELIPRRRNYTSSKIRVRLDLWFRLGARQRSAYLDCPTSRTCDPDVCYTEEGCLRESWGYYWDCSPLSEKGCVTCYKPASGCGDCRRKCSTRSCKETSDCCGLPGVVCRDNAAGGPPEVFGVDCNERLGVCEKASFLDVLEHGLDYSVKNLGRCTWGWDARCATVAMGVRDALKDLKKDAYRDIWAPLIQAVYDTTWEDTELFQCEEDSECYDYPAIRPNTNFDSYCKMAEDEGVCQIRPMYFYGVNQYPQGLETVLAWNEASPEYSVLRTADALEEDDLKKLCKISRPGDDLHGWSDLVPFPGREDGPVVAE